MNKGGVVRTVPRVVLVLLVWGTTIEPLHAQQDNGSHNAAISFLPGLASGLSLDAAEREARTGIRKEMGTSHIILDIGSVFDIMAFRPAGDSSTSLRIGADFFTYALSTNIAGHRLQIDAVDGLFGGHLLLHTALYGSDLTFRLRILHRSAHFVDGHWDPGRTQWRDGRDPIPFTRDFGELLGAYGWNAPPGRLMVYTAISYSTLIRPESLRRFSSLHGIELTSGNAGGHALGKPVAFFAAYNLSLEGVPHYVGTNTVAAGVKFGEWDGAGVKILVSYRSGLELFGEYYDLRRNSWTLGLLFDVW